MTVSRFSAKPGQFAGRGRFRFLVTALFLCAASALASGPGPNGVNIGLDFNWASAGEPHGYTASFIASTSGSGATLNNCGGAVTPTTQACDFVFAYSIGGVPQQGVVPGGVYDTWTPPGVSGRICDANPPNSAPLTLFNCFNTNSFGQVFLASATGTLSSFSMNLTCLNPAGTPPTGLFGVIYQVNAGGLSIPATPLATTPLNLSTCPTLTSWTGHTFSAADFATIPMNFSNVTLTAGNFYAVYFSGLVPGAPLPGSPTVTSVTPSSGPLAGGNTVTITGTGFTGATSVTFNGVASSNFTVVNDTSITAVVPSGAATGAVSVIITTPSGSNNTNTLYSYVVAAPTITSVSPSSGPPAGGNTVTITGTGFTGATSVTFGGVASPNFTIVSDTTITAVVPSTTTTGAVSVVVTSGSGSNAPNTLYSYVIPTPTLGQWGMIVLAVLLVLLAWFKLRQDNKTATS